PLELRVPKPPTVAAAEGRSFLVYELHVTNLGGQPLTLKRVEVLSADAAKRPLLALEDSALTRSLSRPGVVPPSPAPHRTRLAGEGSARWAARPRSPSGSRSTGSRWPTTAPASPATSSRTRAITPGGARRSRWPTGSWWRPRIRFRRTCPASPHVRCRSPSRR